MLSFKYKIRSLCVISDVILTRQDYKTKNAPPNSTKMHFSICSAWSDSASKFHTHKMWWVWNWNGSGSPEMAPRIIIRTTDVVIIPAPSMQVCGKCFERRLAVTSVCVSEGRGHGHLHLQPLRRVIKSQENTVWSCWAAVILILFDVINQGTYIKMQIELLFFCIYFLWSVHL